MRGLSWAMRSGMLLSWVTKTSAIGFSLPLLLLEDHSKTSLITLKKKKKN